MMLSIKQINRVMFAVFCATLVAGCGGSGAGVATSAIATPSRNAALAADSLTKLAAGGEVKFTIAIPP